MALEIPSRSTKYWHAEWAVEPKFIAKTLNLDTYLPVTGVEVIVLNYLQGDCFGHKQVGSLLGKEFEYRLSEDDAYKIEARMQQRDVYQKNLFETSALFFSPRGMIPNDLEKMLQNAHKDQKQRIKRFDARDQFGDRPTEKDEWFAVEKRSRDIEENVKETLRMVGPDCQLPKLNQLTFAWLISIELGRRFIDLNDEENASVNSLVQEQISVDHVVLSLKVSCTLFKEGNLIKIYPQNMPEIRKEWYAEQDEVIATRLIL